MDDSIWKDINIAWAKYNFHYVNNRQDILNQILWYNSHIECRGSVFLHAFLKSSRINAIRDIVDMDTGEFFTYDHRFRLIEGR